MLRGAIILDRFAEEPCTGFAAQNRFCVGTSLLLGSWYGVLSGLVLMILLAGRTMLEERTLCAELPRYAAYMAQVKYRLIPHIW